MTVVIYNPTSFDPVGYWQTPENGYTDDGVHATVRFVHENTWDIVDYTLLRILALAGTIIKVEINAQWHLSESRPRDSLKVSVTWNGGSNWSSEFADNSNPQVDTDFWSDVTSVTVWTWDKLSDANLKVRIKAEHVLSGYVEFLLDIVQVRVTYMPPTIEVSTDYVALVVTQFDSQWQKMNTNDQKPSIRKIIELTDFNLSQGDFCGVYAGDETEEPAFIGYNGTKWQTLLSFTLSTALGHEHLTLMRDEAQRIIHAARTTLLPNAVWHWRRAIDLSDKRRGTWKYACDTVLELSSELI